MLNIVITGANQGIGYYFTEQALKNGNKVAVLDLETDNLEILEQSYPNRLFYYKTDVCKEMQIRTAIADIIEKFQKVDIVIHNASDGISFHIIHPPLTRTKSAEPLPVPKAFMADPKKVGYGIANHISSRHFILCHNFLQKVQTLTCYLFPIKMGRLMSKMTLRYIGNKQ